jgi:hypothetical protein
MSSYLIEYLPASQQEHKPKSIKKLLRIPVINIITHYLIISALAFCPISCMPLLSTTNEI